MQTDLKPFITWHMDVSISMVEDAMISVDERVPPAEPGNHEAELGTREVAELLGVHASTVKRWFRGSSGVTVPGADPAPPVPATTRVTTTAGGHRRIPLRTALRVARERGTKVYLHRFGDDAAEVWNAVRALEDGEPSPLRKLLLRWLKLRKAHLIGGLLRHVTAADPVDARVLDGVLGGFMRRVGEGWRRGELRIADERAASREVSETILTLVADVAHAGPQPRPSAPVAVVGTLDTDQHVLGALLVRLLLVQRGWVVEYLGSGLPAPEIVATQRASGAALVCVSATPPSSPSDVRRFIEVARALADPRRPFALAVGGGGTRGADSAVRSWPFGRSGRFASLAAFQHWLDRHFPRPEPVHA